ncbi:MAG: hypothetical protein V1910_00240 [bacterium]
MKKGEKQKIEAFLAATAEHAFVIGSVFTIEDGVHLPYISLESFEKIQCQLGKMADLVYKLRSELGLELLDRG